MYKIKLDGIERYIKAYDKMLWQEPGNLELNAPALSPHQYLSCLFNNLGYDKCPVDFLWIEHEIDITSVEKSEVLDYPITRNSMMITKNSDLFGILMCIKNWIISDIERGHILDPNKSFILPNKKEIQFNLNNRIKILRSAVVKPKVESWSKSDIFWRRLYNLNPSVDKEYFEKQLVHFEKYSKDLHVPDGRILFIVALADPDIIASIIKQSEIEATNIVSSRHTNTPIALLREDEIFIEFSRILLEKIDKLYIIYRNSGIRGFIQDGYKIYKIDEDKIPTLGSDVNLIYPIRLDGSVVERQIIGEIYNQIAAIPIDGDTLSYISKYVDLNSLRFVERMQDLYKQATYKRLYYTLEQIKNYKKEILNPKDRLIFSEAFYIDCDNNAIYSKLSNKFYIANSDLILREMSPIEAVSYYRNYIGISIELDPTEIGNAFEAKLIPYVDLKELERRSYGIINSNSVQQMPTVIINPNRYTPPQPVEEYGFNVNRILENI